MRIARVLTRMNLGGPARQVLASDPRLVARGHVVRVFAGRAGPGEGDLSGEARARGLDVVRVPGLVRGLAPARDRIARRFLARELRAFRPDVIHTHATKAGWIGRRAAPREVPLVHTFHGHVLEGYFPRPVARLLRAREERLARRTARVLAVSHATADDLVRLGVCEEERIVVVPPGADLDELLAIEERSGVLRSLLGVRPEAVLCGVLGRLAAVKRPEWALEVLGLLARRHPELELVFVGDGDQRGRLERAIAALPSDQARRAHLVGARSDVAAVLADLDLCLLASRSEGLPVALIESAAAGLPAVATPVGGVPEIVAHERTGFLGADPAELAYGVARYLEDPRERKAAGARARLRVRQRYGARALADRLEAVYRAVAPDAAGERAG